MRRQARALLDIAQRPLVRQFDELKAAIGRQEARAVASQTYARVRDAEFKVYSQWGEDGIIQYLIHKVPIENPSFIEFGVQDYSESNTRFLLVNDNWKGLIFDAGSAHLEYARATGLSWRYELDARSAFITPENVNEEFRKAGMTGDIGLLSVDIDGNDYWVLAAIDVVSPRILVVEYNSTFGPDHAVTVPPDPTFDRTRAHHSNLYFGASVAAFTLLAAKKGYSFVTSNSAGNNLFYVRNDVLGSLPVLSPREGWVASRFRESRDVDGNLTFVGSHRARLELIRDMPVVDLTTDRRVTIGELYGLGRT
jgi:hypothetical protein